MLFRLMNDKKILINQFINKMISWRSIFNEDFKIQLMLCNIIILYLIKLQERITLINFVFLIL